MSNENGPLDGSAVLEPIKNAFVKAMNEEFEKNLNWWRYSPRDEVNMSALNKLLALAGKMELEVALRISKGAITGSHNGGIHFTDAAIYGREEEHDWVFNFPPTSNDVKVIYDLEVASPDGEPLLLFYHNKRIAGFKPEDVISVRFK